jgi:CHAD domain-containing protein
MAFRVRKDESVGNGLARVFRKELKSAIDQLTSKSSNDAVHEARKSIKKVRSVLQLVGDELDAGKAAKHIREASHLLSPLRDSEMMIETAKSLGSIACRSIAGSCAPQGARLAMGPCRIFGARRSDQAKLHARA